MISRIFLFLACLETGYFLADMHHPVNYKRTS
jgi:hypothetical protein